jgi:hypothetical protein
MTTAITNQVEAALDALTSNPAVSDDALIEALADLSDRVSNVARSLSARMTHDQRRAMFAAFTDVFGSETKEARKVFTRLVLGKPADAPVSWADNGDRNGQGALTQREASRVLDALIALEVAL